MALMRDLSQAQLAFQVAGGDLDRFDVIRYRGTEGLCQLYRFEIDLVATDEAVQFDEIVGKPAVLSINTEKGERWFHGIVSRFEHTGETAGQNYFRAEMVPSVWLLTHRYNSRIYQERKVTDIISDVLDQGGISSDRFDLTGVKGSYEPREYCVQYRETDYNFICRLMEEEGIYWYFKQTQEGHVLMLADSRAAYTPISGDSKLPYHAPTGMKVEEEHVYRFRIGQSVRPGKVALTDHNFKKPALDLSCTSDASRDPGLEFYDFPGEYAEKGAGQGLAKIRMEEFEARRIEATGKSNSYRLSPGQTFEMVEHPSTPNNKKYLITSVTHQGKQSTARTSAAGGNRGLLSSEAQGALDRAGRSEDKTIREIANAVLNLAARVAPTDETANRSSTPWVFHGGQVSSNGFTPAMVLGGDPLSSLTIPNLIEDVSYTSNVDRDAPVYECRFACVPDSVTFRPPRITPWPEMRGAQIATVTGPAGEEIYPDKYGRVKVQFPWDREGKYDDKSSCWIRVSQGSAGGQYGMMFLPRIGQEVVVTFLEGNPDQPLITGRVYNADQMPPYTLPDEKTKSCIKTHSSKGGGGSNEVRFEDLKDSEQILIHAQKDLHLRTLNDRVENVDNDHHLTVKENKHQLVKKSEHSEVKLDLSELVGGKKSLTVGGDVAEKFGANHKHDVKLTYALKASQIKLEATQGIELVCGGSSIRLLPSIIYIQGGPTVGINSSAGPGLPPVSASPSSPKSPIEADTVAIGKDVTYSGGRAPETATTDADSLGHSFVSPSEEEKKKRTWIEAQLVDEIGEPIAGEKCQIRDANGEIIYSGSTGADGCVHAQVPEPGTCEICFPDLDALAWERLR